MTLLSVDKTSHIPPLFSDGCPSLKLSQISPHQPSHTAGKHSPYVPNEKQKLVYGNQEIVCLIFFSLCFKKRMKKN